MSVEPATALLTVDLDRIQPPVLYSPWWWVPALVAVAAAALATWMLRRVLAARDEPAEGDLEALRAATLRRLGDIAASPGGDAVTRRALVGRLGAEVRSFLGVATGSDLDYTTRTQWLVAADRDPRLGTAVDLLLEISDVVFRAGGDADVAGFGRRAVEVVSSWR